MNEFLRNAPERLNFKNVSLVVIGDVMLDRFCWGTVDRISPEAPVPVVRLDRTSEVAGGAANVAANVIGLGARAELIGLVGEDEDGAKLAAILEATGISSSGLIRVAGRTTTVKTRIVAHSQQIVRLDSENSTQLSDDETDSVWPAIATACEQADIVIVSDYAKGFLTDHMLDLLITNCRAAGKRVLVDPKGKDYLKYKGAALLTPNQKEAAEACRFDVSGSEWVDRAGTELIEMVGAEAVLVTRGAEGMSLFERDRDVYRFPALARKVYDVTGAGDTVVSTLGVALASGFNYRDAAALANIAAGLVVEQVGTTAIDRELLCKTLRDLRQSAG